MDKFLEIKHHKMEETYFWFRAHRDIILKLVQAEDRDSKILDVGCVGGFLIELLKQSGFNNIYGIDISEKAINLCKRRGIKNVSVMDATQTKFRASMFDIIIAADLLEHVKDEHAALIEWNRILRPNGKLLIFTPAFNFLWSEHDELHHHYRRYSRAILIEALKRANFQVNRSSYWNSSLFFPVLIVRIYQRFFLKKGKKRDQLYELNPRTNEILFTLLKLENWLLKKINFPIGVSVFAVATKLQ